MEALMKGKCSNRLLNRYRNRGVRAEGLEAPPKFLKSELLRQELFAKMWVW
jgi:hypothetical protein